MFKPFNPFMQKRPSNIEVTLKPCPDCKGTGHIRDEDNTDEETSICLRCGGSGEIVEKNMMNKAIPPNVRMRSPHIRRNDA